MRVVLVALLVVVAVDAGFLNSVVNFFRQNSTNETVQEIQQKLKTARLELTNKLKSSIRGVDPEKRRLRLEALRNRTQSRISHLTNEQVEELENLKTKITKVKIDPSPKAGEDDLFKVNELAGVSDYMYQGDINLDETQIEKIESDDGVADATGRKKRQVSTTAKKWTSNNVYYVIDSTINARKKASITAALTYLQSRTCLNFIESSSATNRIRVFSGSGCYSNIGMTGGEQTLSLGDGCEVIGTVAHEFTHALGVWHTQMRYDRDTYVTIDLSSVASSLQGNFGKQTSSSTVNNVPYEYGSFMHYSSMSFVNSGGSPSIVPKDVNFLYTMGNRQISFYDIQMINLAYSCNKCTNTLACANGGVQNPRNCAACLCPLGYGGTLCNTRPTGCGETLTATTAWTSKTFSFGNTTDYTNTRDDFTLCNHWITAPTGKTIQTQITYMYNPQCNYGCAFNGIEIKTMSDTKITNPRICCTQFQNVVYSSTLNPTPIISYNRYYYTTFTIQYRYV